MHVAAFMEGVGCLSVVREGVRRLRRGGGGEGGGGGGGVLDEKCLLPHTVAYLVHGRLRLPDTKR